jgi:hypothetical protein
MQKSAARADKERPARRQRPNRSHSLPTHFPEELLVRDLIDTHFHGGPDVFDRIMDDEEAAKLCQEKGISAVVLKNHVVPTADRAWYLRKHVHGIQAFGGIVLNGAVGGINPDAVEWMCRMQGGYGRFVWFPTIDGDHHVRHFGDGESGIPVLDENGHVLPEALQVLKICAKQKLVVNTGHLSPREALALISVARDIGVDRLVVTHAQFEVVNMSPDDMRLAVQMGAKLELCAIGQLMGPQASRPWMREWRHVRIQETVATIRMVGPENCILATDLGSAGNPTHADGMQMFVRDLMSGGISADQIKIMGREVAGALLMG